MRAEFKKERIKLWQIKIMETITLLQDAQSQQQGSLKILHVKILTAGSSVMEKQTQTIITVIRIT